MSEWQFRNIWRALLIISHQIHINELKLNKLLERAGEDKQLIGLTAKLKKGKEDLQAALDAQGAETKTKPKGKKKNGKSNS